LLGLAASTPAKGRNDSKPGAVPSLAAKLEEFPRRSDDCLIELGIFIMSAIMHVVSVLSRLKSSVLGFFTEPYFFQNKLNVANIA
jgi:hypothetical protein